MTGDPTIASRASRLPHRARRGAPLLALVLALVAAGCVAPISFPAETARIELVSTTVSDGYQFDYYRNRAFPCAIAGDQTFVVATRVGQSPTSPQPLWVRMRGGGVGWFDSTGAPQPNAAVKSEETASQHIARLLGSGLMQQVRFAPEGFRLLDVSMCSHDIYAGANVADPNNPNLQADGSPRTVNGLFATKSAIDFVRARYPTNDFFLHGTSAGGFGSWHVAWGLQEQGTPPTGFVSDAGILNQEWESARVAQAICFTGDRDVEALTALQARLHPTVMDPRNQPDLLVARGELTVPVVHIYSVGDTNACGDTPMQCPLRDGSVVTMGAAKCRHEPMRLAIAAQGPGSRSLNLDVCVEGNAPTTCDRHVVTGINNPTNTDPRFPANYLPLIMDWIRARLADAP